MAKMIPNIVKLLSVETVFSIFGAISLKWCNDEVAKVSRTAAKQMCSFLLTRNFPSQSGLEEK